MERDLTELASWFKPVTAITRCGIHGLRRRMALVRCPNHSQGFVGGARLLTSRNFCLERRLASTLAPPKFRLGNKPVFLPEVIVAELKFLPPSRATADLSRATRIQPRLRNGAFFCGLRLSVGS